MRETRQLCTFRVDEYLFGIDVRRIQELIRNQEITPVPLAPSGVRGLINLRGQIVTALDLRTRLELVDRTNSSQARMQVVVRANGGVVSLLVDSIGDVVEVNEESFERPPETLCGVARHLVRGVYKLSDCLLLLLDTERAVKLSGDGARQPSPDPPPHAGADAGLQEPN